jgi:hypothetical protein
LGFKIELSSKQQFYVGKGHMTAWREKLGKIGIADVLSPKDFPEEPIEGHPTPWMANQAGNGHLLIYDAHGAVLFHVYCWDEGEYKEFRRKLARINGINK